jgi:uncharacterized membrane protein YbaN (DUF454 family)
MMVRIIYLTLGFAALLIGAVGIVVPLLPTVPFVLLAAFFFARSSPRLERWLVDHPRFGPHIWAWRTRRAISRKGKKAALICFLGSAVSGFFLLPLPWSLAPLAVALVGGSWIATRADA